MPEERNAAEEANLVNYIMTRRIYDVLLGIYSNINPAEADSLARLHEAGLFASPDPAISYEEPNDADEV